MMVQNNLLEGLLGGQSVNASGQPGAISNSAEGGFDSLFGKVMQLMNSDSSPEEIISFLNKESQNLSKEDKDLLFQVVAEKIEAGEEAANKDLLAEHPLLTKDNSGVNGKESAAGLATLDMLREQKSSKDIAAATGKVERPEFFKSNQPTKTPLNEILGIKPEISTNNEAKAVASNVSAAKVATEVVSTNQPQENQNIDPRLNKLILPKEGVKKAETVKLAGGDDFLQSMNTMGKVNKNNVTLASNAKVQQFASEQNLLNKNLIQVKKMNFETPQSLEGTDSEISNVLDMTRPEVANQNLLQEAVGAKAAIGSQINATTKANILDLSGINMQDTDAIIKQISDYVTQSRVENADSLDLAVNHDSLGRFKIQVMNGGSKDTVDLKIMAQAEEANSFFKANEVDLLKHLAKSGVKVTDFKIALTDSSNLANSSFDKGSQDSQSGNFQSQNFNSKDQSQSDQGSRKRQQLWDEYRERLGA